MIKTKQRYTRQQLIRKLKEYIDRETKNNRLVIDSSEHNILLEVLECLTDYQTSVEDERRRIRKILECGVF